MTQDATHNPNTENRDSTPPDTPVTLLAHIENHYEVVIGEPSNPFGRFRRETYAEVLTYLKGMELQPQTLIRICHVQRSFGNLASVEDLILDS